jgi:hypothetical protein
MRTAIRIRPARSIWVPPTSTVLPWPIFSSIAAASDGEAFYPAFPGEPSAQRSQIVAEPMQTGVRPRQQSARATARRLVMVLIPIGIIPLRGLDVSTRT